jgi:hypothetical protein
VFDWFASALGPSHQGDLFLLHPSDLMALLEYAWDHRSEGPQPTGDPRNRSDVQGMSSTWAGQFLISAPPQQQPPLPPLPADTLTLIKNAIDSTTAGCGGVMWEHLIYAYMLENTRVYDIFRRVVDALVHSERLGMGHEATLRWLRNTELLLYRETAPFFIPSVMSAVRPDMGATRRNAYQRMFGMELNHGTDLGGPYPYVKSDSANNDFVSIFEEFLREVWIGMVNVNNSSGPKPTDDAKIAELATRLNNMLLSRRLYGAISETEYWAISWLSWFDLTLSDNFPIIQDLRAEAASPEERLFKIAQLTQLPAHGLSKSYFEIAKPISRILILLETGSVNAVADVPVLYIPGPDIARDMHTIITHWSIVSGRDMKARKVSPS